MLLGIAAASPRKLSKTMHKKIFWCLLAGCNSSDGSPEKPAQGETGQPIISDSGQPPDEEPWEPWNERVSLSLSGTVVKYLERTPISENACVEVYDRGSTLTGEPELLAHTEVRPDGSWETDETEFKTQIGPLAVLNRCDAETASDFSPSGIFVSAESLHQADQGYVNGLLIEAISYRYTEDIRASLQSADPDNFIPIDEGIFGRILDPLGEPASEAAV